MPDYKSEEGRKGRNIIIIIIIITIILQDWA